MANLRFALNNAIDELGSLMNGPPIVLGAINSCDTPSNPGITRASGSYIADGVRPGALLSGAIASSFPANTYVKIVTDLELTMSANATGIATDVGATFTPYVTRDEVAPYTLDNLMVRDRRVLWQSTGASDPVDIDLGGNRSIGYVGLHGHRGLGGGGIGTLLVKWASAATGYPPASGGSWTTAATIAGPERDKGTAIGTISARYLRFEIDIAGSAWTLGRFHAGALTDLGFIATSIRELESTPLVVDRSAAGEPLVTYLGDIHSDFELVFNSIPDSVLTTLRSIASRQLPFVFLDQFDVAHDCICTEPLDALLKFMSAGVGLWDVRMRIEELG